MNIFAFARCYVGTLKIATTVCVTMLNLIATRWGYILITHVFSPQVTVIMLAVFLHYGNGKAITYTNNDNIEYLNGEGQPAAWRLKRSPDDEPGCYTGSYTPIILPNNAIVSVPICKNVTSVGLACISSMANNNNQRKCEPTCYLTVEKIQFPTRCACAP